MDKIFRAHFIKIKGISESGLIHWKRYLYKADQVVTFHGLWNNIRMREISLRGRKEKIRRTWKQTLKREKWID